MNKIKVLSLMLSIVSSFIMQPSFAQDESQNGFLRKGTLANDPNDKLRIFLYVPGYTLLYDIGEVAHIPSRVDGYVPYRVATTQDGIRVLVREKDIRRDLDSLKRYDFLVNRHTPYCETPQACQEIWSKFPRFVEGDDWDTVWPRVTGRFLDEPHSEVHAVELSISGKTEKGYIPKIYRELPLEDYGFLTHLNRGYPTYRYKKEEIIDLKSECGHEKLTSSTKETYLKIEAYAKASVNASFDVSDSLSKALPKSVASAVLSFLGLSANISADAFVGGNWKLETVDSAANNLFYGNRDENWSVESVWIERKVDNGDEKYNPYGTMLIKKIYSCRANQKIEMNFASILFTTFPKDTSIPAYPKEPLILDTEIIADANLPNEKNDRALLSVNTQTSHHKAIDYLGKKGLPKSIANFIVKELNRGQPR